MNTIKIIWLKELLDTIRDRRTLFAMVLAPIIVMPLFSILPQILIGDQIEKQEEMVLKVAVSGGENAPMLLNFMEEAGQVELITSEDPAQAVLDDKAIVGIVIPSEFEENIIAELPTSLKVMSDQSKLLADVQVSRVRLLMEAYNRIIVQERMTSRGLDPALLSPIAIQSENLATPQQMGGSYMAMMLPLFIMLWTLIGGVYTAIDLTAGEKERLTLEPLLTTPASRTHIVTGKLLAVITTSLIGLILAIASLVLSYQYASPSFFGNAGGATFTVSWSTAFMLLGTAVPVLIMFAGIEIAICLFARTFKEAQNYIVPLQFGVMLPSMSIMFAQDLSLSSILYAVPILGPTVMLRDVLLGSWEMQPFLVMLISSLLYAIIAIRFAIRQFNTEKVLFRT